MVGVDGRNGLHGHALNFVRNRYALAAGSEAGFPPKISAAIRLVSIPAGTPQYIATSNSTSCTCSFVHPFASAPLAWTRNSAGLLLAAVMPSITRLRISLERPERSQISP